MRLLRTDEIDCRVAQVKENGCSLLLYKDARCDMRILDETYGADNWQRSHEVINGNLFCNVGVRFQRENGFGEWVWKQDVGTESNTEKEKGQASDSFKRACFNWGIGRELYTAPFIWIQLKEDEIFKTKSGSLGVKTKFSVAEIDYEDDKIVSLVITDNKGQSRFTLNKKKKAAPVETIGQEKAEILAKLFVEKVEAKAIKQTAMKETLKKYGINKLADLTPEQHGKILNGLYKATNEG